MVPERCILAGMPTDPPVIVEHVFNPDPDEGHRAHLRALDVLVAIILDNDERYGLPEKVDRQQVA